MAGISFFIPAYNCDTTLKEAVESILISNFSNGDELILVNDSSTDDTAHVIAELKITYPAIKVINHHRNKGGAATRNTAIEASSNELLFCLDSDNILEANSVQPLKDYLIKSNADVASFQHLNYFSRSVLEINEVWTFTPGIFTSADALSGCVSPGAGGNYLFTKNSWVQAGGYPEFAGAFDTWGFGIRQLLSGSKLMVLEGTGYYHRLSENSYFLRDAWNRKRSMSIRATQILIPFFDQIEEEDIDYILSKKHRYSWFERLDSRPLKLVKSPKKNPVFQADLPPPDLKQKVRRIINKVKNLMQLRKTPIVDVALPGEYKVLEKIIADAEETVVIFDVGANKGDYTRQILKIAEHLNKKVEVHLFEPQQQNLELLHSAFDQFTNVIVNDFGLSDKNEMLPIFSVVQSSELGSLYNRKFFEEQNFSTTREMVRLVPVEGYIKERNLKAVDLMKIDVEGHELTVISGLREMLSNKSVRSIQFEYGGTYLDAGTTLSQIYTILEPYYKIGKITEGDISYTDYQSTMEDFHYSNYLAVLREN